jgi:NADH:ubiquinone oxidoreductase subunit 6 (subunit J)
MQTFLFAAAGDAWPKAWPLAVTALVGGVAIYRLLPRPHPRAVMASAVLGLIALLLAALLVTRAEVASPEVVLFYAFSFLAVVGAALLVTQHNPARAALSFALVILSTCGLFLLLAGPFLMAATIIIYAGAIIVTFLFVLMLAQQAGLSDADARSREPLLATASGFILLFLLLYLLQQSYGTQDIDRLLAEAREARDLDSPEAIDKKVGDSRGEPSKGDSLFERYKDFFKGHRWDDLHHQAEDVELSWVDAQHGTDVGARRKELERLVKLGEQGRDRLGWLQPDRPELPASSFSGPPPTVSADDFRRDDLGRPRLPADNSAYLGRSLFTDYLLPVELGGLLLLIATVGAIAIAHRREPGRSA